jgi:Arc-like DNA binding domain
MPRPKTVSINLRLPADLHKQLAEAAASSSPAKSLNSEILSRLIDSFEAEERLSGLEARISKIEAETQAVVISTDQRIKVVEARTDQLAEVQGTLARVQQLKRRKETLK